MMNGIQAIIGKIKSTDYDSVTQIFTAVVKSDVTYTCTWRYGGFLRDHFYPGQAVMISGKIENDHILTNPKFLALGDSDKICIECGFNPVISKRDTRCYFCQHPRTFGITHYQIEGQKSAACGATHNPHTVDQYCAYKGNFTADRDKVNCKSCRRTKVFSQSIMTPT